jgi:MFS family permease
MKQEHLKRHLLQRSPTRGKLFLICGLAAFFYLYEFMIRVMPSAMAHDLMYSFKIHASSLGWLSALFFYGYIPMQIPAGLLFDHWGARRLLALATLLCALATGCFAISSSLSSALALRFIMGFCGAFAFTGAAFTAAKWVPARYFAMYTGLIQTLGCVGAIAGQAPIAYLNHLFGWRHTNLYAAAVGIIFAILTYIFVLDKPKTKLTLVKPTNKNLETKTQTHLQRLAAVTHNKQNWWIGSFGALSWASINLFTALWGIPYLMQYYQIDAVSAGTILSSCWIGVAIGSPVIGWWSKKSADRLGSMLFCITCGLIASTLILSNYKLPISIMVLALFFLGISAGGQPISFDLIYDNNKKSNIGTAIGFNNMLVISGGLILQPLAGYIIQYSNSNLAQGHYALANYQHALLIMPTCYIINFAVTLFGINKKCRQHKMS